MSDQNIDIKAGLAHFELAGRYSLKAVEASAAKPIATKVTPDE